VDQLRNLAVVSHGGAGKTTLAEAMLYLSGGVDRLGKVDDGTSTMDYDPDEVKRKSSINASVAPVEWKDNKINFIDTPGYSDFVGDVVWRIACSRLCDGACRCSLRSRGRHRAHVGGASKNKTFLACWL